VHGLPQSLAASKPVRYTRAAGRRLAMGEEREFPDWENLYREQDVESMPWYYPGLDPDFADALECYGVTGGRALDLGTGPGTQAIALAERGFRVTATDLSGPAVRKARIAAREKGLEVDFRQDDILESTLGKAFDLVIDRGVFHVFPPKHRHDYVARVYALVNPGGYLFLKCFSHLETREEGPYRLSPDELRSSFGGDFEVLAIRETVFQGTLESFPKALFMSARKPSA
jgi:2-polyprenyl-3-methyl-5-hydroxy-6-metoxy-1,4-benzoquinol methylase